MKNIIAIAAFLAVHQGILALPNPISQVDNSKGDVITSDFVCPSGTFVKQMKWSAANQLRTGIEIYCHEPRSLVAKTQIRTHGSGSLSGDPICSAVRAIDLWMNNAKEDINIKPLCDKPPVQNKPNADMWYACSGNSALCGLQTQIDSNNGAIRDTMPWCCDVGDIESICAAHDKRSVLFVCDAGSAQHPLKCSRAKTVGYGFTNSSSQEHHIERSFYEEFGFEMGYAGFGLSYNFHMNVGQSETTGYNWGTTQESTFQEEITITVEAEAPGGCITEVVEIIGECAFMQVRPNYFQRLDNCSNVLFTTEEVIPKTINPGQTYISKIPEKVLTYLKTSKNV